MADSNVGDRALSSHRRPTCSPLRRRSHASRDRADNDVDAERRPKDRGCRSAAAETGWQRGAGPRSV